ncbi:MAG: DUF2341 domain-containing protein [Terracidiphilus sp.]
MPTSSNAWNFSGDMTLSAWIKTTGNSLLAMQLQDGNPLAYLSVGPTTAGGGSGEAVAYFRTDGGSVLVASGNTAINDGNWHHLQTVRSTGEAVLIYVDGILETTTAYSDSGPIDVSGGGANIGGGGNTSFNGLIDEARISSVARSADWIATEFNNQSAPSTFYAFGSEASSLSPESVSLYASQSQQFTLAALGTCSSGGVSWAISPTGVGSISSSGLYTAPASISSQQTVTVEAMNSGGGSQIGSATVTLFPPISVSVTPTSVTIPDGSQPQQFTASVANTGNAAVTWALSPAGLGTISASGLYISPASFTTQQTVTVTATSQADPTKSASVTITLSPLAPPSTQCASNGYNYKRAIAIDHTQVPHTDQINFPYLFNATDPAFATIANGGHVSNFNGYDIFFSTDPAGLTKLDHELEEYNPATGQVIAWVRIPTLSHTKDTILYVFYGNPSISTPQQNPASVWDTNYQAVYHLANVATGIALDSTANSNNAPLASVLPASGQIDGAGSFDGASSYMQLPSADLSAYPARGQSTTEYSESFGTWFKTASSGVILSQTVSGVEPGGSPGGYGYVPAIYVDTEGLLRVWFFNLGGSGQIVTAKEYNDNNWHLAEVTYANGTETLYVDGQNAGTEQQAVQNGYNPSYSYFVGTGDGYGWGGTNGSWFYFNGSLDEVNLSSTARSSDWVQTEYFNQSSPSTFSTLYPEEAETLIPGAVTLYGSQVQQFVIPSACGSSAAIWSMPSRVPGTLSADGLFTAPSEIETPQTLTITATTLGDSSTPLSATVTLMPPVAVTVTPPTPALYGGQSQQFVATVANTPNIAVTWAINPEGIGTINSSGLYTAPSSVTALQTVTITATSVGDTSKSASATITLATSIPGAISVTPLSATLYGGQMQQFTANVTNNNQAVTWTINPAAVGFISTSGLYTAPTTITTQQTVTVTATSQADPALSASSTITLSPTQCASSGYSFQRVVVIDHTKVPNTDQVNFPFLFNTTDPDFASISNGGQVVSSSGYDIIFSTDPDGLTKLDHEMEEYNPVTGQVIAWVRIPTLSHTTDTVLYVFYGNPNVTSSEQNPTGVWNGNYQAVYHLANTGSGSAADSTANGNNASLTSVVASSGEIDGAASFNGASSYMQIPPADFASYPVGVQSNLGLSSANTTTSFSASFGVWFKTASAGGILGQTSSQECFFNACTPSSPGTTGFGGWIPMLYIDENGSLIGGGVTTATAYADGNWHFATITYATNGTDTLYVDGQNVGSSLGQFPTGYSPSYAYTIGAAFTELWGEGNWNWLYFNGALDEISIANTPVSGDWVQTEYHNQGSPSTFYRLYPRNAIQVAPAAVSLYASQNQQFSVPGTCNPSVAWTMQSGAQGTLTSTGLYTAPGSVTAQQTVSITASSVASGTTIGSAAVTLLPPPPPITLAAAAQPPYSTGTSQTFTATVQDQDGTPEIGVAVTFTVAGPNSNIGSGTTDNSGVASYTYTGANSGTDTVQATAVVNGQALSSGSVSAAWIVPAPPSPAAKVTLEAPPALGVIGLAGAFTDNNGAVIEPIAVGAASRAFVVPAGATQLQLGVDSEYFAGDAGPGFVVAVNGVSVTVPPTAMPWTWVTGGLNNNYQYGIFNPSIQNGAIDGTNPVVAATGLTPGQTVSVAYQSGTASANLPIRPLVNADGDQTWITGANIWQGTYFPTLYMTTSSYPLNQPITFNALVTGVSGTPMVGVPVTLNVSGANAQQLQATTDSTGIASFLYSGLYAGTDTLEAQAFPSGGPSLESGQSSVTWINYATPPSPGSIVLSIPGYVNNLQDYTVLATGASGSPVSDAGVGLYVWGVDNFQLGATTDITGHAPFVYYHGNPGTYNVVAVDTVDRNVVFSNVISGVWTPPGSTSSCNNCNAVTVSISAQNIVTLPSTVQLNGTVTDNVGITPTVAWSQISGPGTVTFTTPQQAVSTAAFSESGVYVVQLSASDAGNSASAQFSITVNPTPIVETPQGWVGSPLYGSTVTGIVPVTLAPGVTLQSGALIYYPTGNPNNVTVLNASVTGSGQIGTLDTTELANGSYSVQLYGTDSSGSSQYSLVLLTVAGNYKPGRVTANVTDLVVPATGLSISIQRQYDSLSAGVSGDFGYGWSLSTSVNLSVDPAGDVTFTLGGQRRTFYLTPQLNNLLGFYAAAFSPEPGFFGTLKDSSPGCANDFDFVVPDGSLWFCIGGGQYNPPGYIYTDSTGTSYTISAGGALQSIQDRSGNGLTIAANGITSTTGLSVLFVRDSSNRITQITDPQGNNYLYAYDDSGNLASVTYPNTTQPSTYTYDASHLYLSGTDFRNNPLPVTTYYTATDTDPNGLPLNGRLQSVSDALGQTTSYAYNLATNTTTVTYPPDASGNAGTATMVYDAYGMLLSSTDPLGNTTTNVYDPNHNLTSVTDPLGHTNSYTYDQNGNKTSATYPATATGTNTTSTTQYNQYSEPTSTTDELGNVRLFNYDANYNPQSVTDSAGTLASFLFNQYQTLQAGAIGFDITVNPAQASQFSYDANGNLTSRTDALGRTTSYTYNSLGQKTAMVAPTPATPAGGPASTTNYQYDALGDLTQTAAPLGRTTGSTFDGNGNKISDTDARGNITTYTYDALNRLITTTYPTQPATTSTKTYDFRNNVINETDQNGNITHHVYDLAGRQVSVTRGYGTSNASTTTYAYDNAGRKTGETDALGHTTTYTYDADSRLIAIAGPKGNFTYAYDNAGNRISQTDANNNKTQFQYDARKRLVKTIYPDTTTVTNTYDGPGNLASVTDQAGNVVQYTYDAANQLKTVVQLNHPNPSNNTNSYTYDNLGNLITLSDENLHVTANSFDLFGENVQKVLPDGTLTETRSYDTAGNLVSLTHFNGVTTSYTYDALNRLLSRTTPGEPAVSFTYTPTGKRATMSVGSWTTTYSYDSLDRLTTKAAPAGTLSYSYDDAGNLASMSSNHPNGVSVSYAYDELNRLSTVTDDRLQGNQTTTYTYDPASNVAAVNYPNGVQSAMTYDALNRITGLATQSSGYLYQRGPTGNLTSATELNGRTLNWSYDGIYRLTNETIGGDPDHNNGSAGYRLDPVGNRLSLSSSLPGIESGSFGYNADDEVSSETYDSNGNTLATGGKTFTYDSENHLTSMNGGAVRLIYDGDGNRVAKVVGGVTTQYLVDDLNPTGLPQVVEEVVNGAVTRQYTYGLQRISENQVVNNTWTPSFYGYDGGGSVRNLTNASGTVTDSYEYDAFGNSFTKQGTTPNSYLYRGEQFDADLGLYYLRARYYNPNTGRFLSRDPEDGKQTDPASLHKYLYANGDPVNGMDPNGREDLVETGWLTKARVIAAVAYASACGWAIYDLYDKIDDALDNVYNMPGPSYDPHGHHYVPEWQLLRQVYITASTCGGPAVGLLIASY